VPFVRGFSASLIIFQGIFGGSKNAADTATAEGSDET